MTVKLEQVTEPLLICGAPRSGASLVTDLFNKHGWWTGICKSPTRYKPYPNHDNIGIHVLMNKYHPHIIKNTDFALPVEDDSFRKDILSLVVDSNYQEHQKWAIKFDPRWYAIFRQAFPDSNWICVRRDPLSCYHSCMEGEHFMAGIVDPHAMFISLHCQNDILDHIEKNFFGTNIFPKELVMGHYASLTKALKSFGVDIDKKTTQKTIDKKLWIH